jgi:phosphate transport system substrate-binding protein
MVKRRKWAVVAAVAALALVAAACGDDDGDGADGGTEPTGPANLEGTIVVSGSSTVEPISALVAEIFNETNPELFCNGETDISDASRPIEQEEIDACEANGIQYTELEVAFDGITVMTNPENTAVECLNNGDLYALFGPESEGFTTWSDANALAQQVGGNGNFPDEPLDITAPGEESGTYDAFIELSGIPDIAIEQGIPEDESEALRKDYQASPNDNVIIQAMAGSPSSLGFVGFAFAEEAGDQVREIAVDGGDGCVSPSDETIRDASYPLSRSLFIYVNNEKVGQSEALQAYVDYYLTDEALNELVSEVGYIPLPTDRIEATRGVWAEVA